MSKIKAQWEIEQELNRMAGKIADFSLANNQYPVGTLRATWSEANTQFVINTIAQRKKVTA